MNSVFLFTLKRSFIFSLSLNWTIVSRCIVDWSVRPVHSCNRYQNAAAWLLTGKQNGDHIVPVLASPAHCEKLILKIFLLVWEALQLQVKVGELFEITGKCKWHLANKRGRGVIMMRSFLLIDYCWSKVVYIPINKVHHNTGWDFSSLP